MHIDQPHKSLVLTFDASGEVEGLHMDKFDLGFLGDKTVRRATEIVFDETGQKWDIIVCLPNGRPAPFAHSGQSGFATYEQARDVEVAWLNLCRVQDVEWSSIQGAALLDEARLVVIGR